MRIYLDNDGYMEIDNELMRLVDKDGNEFKIKGPLETSLDMEEMMTNKTNYDCGDCKYLLENYEGTFTCKKTGKTFKDWDGACTQFEKMCSCDTCKYATTRIYETGEIDEIDYMCVLQNNKIMYMDANIMRTQNAEFPECNIGLYEEEKD